ncbi:hypothetical protein QO002_003284 [Pararhizobium capsulatum DSM 1112]|uniref:Uncharacterized protein n=1 Tax=Pararhizobium capsulatum DSM 1112 TaxID=1121113 RepID=A0ABU0BSA5_9HYPH|nr:hypothetical protein [Pararhizobium capsulatum]MDQ0321146.1 hypothetical protein [Pararhizobium capsulatum DSM 1112]
MSVIKLRMVEKFEVPVGSCSPSLLLASEPPEIIKILRLLSGTAHLRDDGTDEVLYEANQNFINPGDDIALDEIDRILDYIFEERPDEDEIASLFRRARILNKGFYIEILAELGFLLKSLGEQKFTESFLYTYRILERISAACPLIYVSNDKDFRHAHSFLSSIYDEKKAPGELGMLQKFLQHYTGLNEGFARATLDFSLAELGDDLATALIDEFKTIILPEIKTLVIDEENGIFSVPFKDVGSFVVTVRNRTFHNLGARANFNLSRIGGSEPLFALLVPILLYWFSYVFVDFAKWQISKA